jgi:hypothetical protein
MSAISVPQESEVATMTIPRAVLALTALGFLGFGAAFALWPVPMAALVDIQLPSSTARADFGATYGGFELGFGGFLLLCLRRPAWVEAGLWAGALALSGFAVVRLLGLLLGQMPVRSTIYVALTLEITGVLLNAWALKAVQRS